jgi:hypothetical protein
MVEWPDPVYWTLYGTQEYCCMITQLGHKLEPKAVAVWRALIEESGWEDKFGCSFLVVIWLVCFNNWVRNLESTPPTLSVLHNEAQYTYFHLLFNIDYLLLQITSLPSCLSTWCLVLTLLRQTLHSLTATHTVCVRSVLHLLFYVTGVLMDTAAVMIWSTTAALTYLSVLVSVSV